MTAAILGFAASRVMADVPVRFDLDPLDADAATWQTFQTVVSKIDTAVADHLRGTGRAPAGKVHSGTAPDYAKGAVIMGVYQLAGQSAPVSVSDPVLSTKGRRSGSARLDAVSPPRRPATSPAAVAHGIEWRVEGAEGSERTAHPVRLVGLLRAVALGASR